MHHMHRIDGQWRRGRGWLLAKKGLRQSGVGFLVGLLLLPVGVLAQGAGDLDTSFGGDGTVTTNVGSEGNSVAFAVALQPDGKIIVAGDAFSNGNADFALARYRRNGALDPTFGDAGRVITDVGGYDNVGGMALQPDGNIVVAGGAFIPSKNSYDFALVRYLPNGALDPTFGDAGRVITDFGGGDRANAVALQPDGRIVVAGFVESLDFSNVDFALARYLPNGSLDPTFGDAGRVITDFGALEGAHAVVLQPDGKIVVAGDTFSKSNLAFALARYRPNGSLDPTFGDAGLVTNNFGAFAQAFAVALQPDGKIVAAGSGGSGNDDFALARYRPNGSLDPTFGDAGLVTTDVGDIDLAGAVTLQPDGRIVAAGYAENLSTGLNNFALVRYEPNGSLDPTFGDAGRVITDVGGFSNAFALVIQPHDARLVVAGGLSGNGFALARYHAITCNGVVVTQVGTAGDDTIIGTEGHDVIWGFPGNDLIEGLGGDDLLCGGKGDDTLRGGSGKDILDGGAGKDRCNGGSGQDMARECEKVTNVP